MRLHDCVVVADTSRGLTCHTRSASAPHYSLRHWSPSRVAPLVRAARLHRHASGNSREPWADTGDARASLHLRSALTGLSFPTGWEKVSRSFHSLSLFFLPSRLSASHALLSLLFAVCRAIASRSASARSSLFLFPSRRPVRTEMRRVHGARRTSSTCTTRCNACYCPSCYRYAIDRHATQPHHRVTASRGCSVLAARVSSDRSVTPGRVTTPPIDSMSIRPSCCSD